MIIIQVKLITFFARKIIESLTRGKLFAFSHDYYECIKYDAVCDKTYDRKITSGSLFDDISILKWLLKEPHGATEITLDKFAIILLEVGKHQIEGPGKFSCEFIFKRKTLKRILNMLLKRLKAFKISEFKLTKTTGWFIPYNKMFYLDEDSSGGSVMRQIDFKPAFEKIISIYEGKTPLEEFDVEMFYWLLKVCVYNSYH